MFKIKAFTTLLEIVLKGPLLQVENPIIEYTNDKIAITFLLEHSSITSKTALLILFIYYIRIYKICSNKYILMHINAHCIIAPKNPQNIKNNIA